MTQHKLHSVTAYTVDGHTEKIEFSADAEMTVDERYITLEYIEPPQGDDADAVLTRLTVHNDGAVTLVRSAFTSGKQIMGITLKEGENNDFLYTSDVGALQMTCIPKVVAPRLKAVGGIIVLKYDLDFGDGEPVQYHMIITVEA